MNIEACENTTVLYHRYMYILTDCIQAVAQDLSYPHMDDTYRMYKHKMYVTCASGFQVQNSTQVIKPSLLASVKSNLRH